MSEHDDQRSTTDWLMDLCVYAPIGLVLDAPKYLPEFVEKGRNQVALARFIGKAAVGQLEKQLGPLGTFLRAATPAGTPHAAEPEADVAAASGPEPEPDVAAAPEPDGAAAAPAAPRQTRRNSKAAGSGSGPGPARATARRAGPASAKSRSTAVPAESQLAITGYSTLSASQIVPRLTTLSRADVEAIGRFERANRGRRTILNRVEQLLAGS